MNLTELEEKFPDHAATWRAAGIDLSDDTTDRAVRLHHQGEPIGIIRDSDRFPDRFEYCALITEVWPVPFPAGFMPDDPFKALASERERWLPKGENHR
ncbi:hypothetical protein ABT095_33755 [Kitasatospora sp. NPDC002227]|uniref:hypothetical protein n=1 Tax=Kitasatospora sp. NPDC002227 TaxID=3154773 RepID=UPI003320EF8C